jgi:hypothetical protein
MRNFPSYVHVHAGHVIVYRETTLLAPMQKTPIERVPILLHPIPTLTELPRLFPTIRQVQL